MRHPAREEEHFDISTQHKDNVKTMFSILLFLFLTFFPPVLHYPLLPQWQINEQLSLTSVVLVADVTLRDSSVQQF